jgi:hypothetical protein
VKIAFHKTPHLPKRKKKAWDGKKEKERLRQDKGKNKFFPCPKPSTFLSLPHPKPGYNFFLQASEKNHIAPKNLRKSDHLSTGKWKLLSTEP